MSVELTLRQKLAISSDVIDALKEIGESIGTW